MMTKVTLDIFKKQMAEGVWVLCEASETMQLFVEKNFPERYEQEIRKYRTPRKYIKQGEKIIVVSISQQIWAGVEKYNLEDIIIREINGRITVLKNTKRVERIVTAVDNQIDESFKQQMVATGYVTAEEYDKYMNSDNQDELTLIVTTAF
jgi:hypothetical protein